MSVVAVDLYSFLADVTHREKVKLFFARNCTTSGVDREQDRPCNAATQEAQDNHNLEKAHEEITVDRLVIQNVLILEVLEIFQPSEEATALWWSLSLGPQMIKIRPRRVDSAKALAENEKGRDKGSGEDCCRY